MVVYIADTFEDFWKIAEFFMEQPAENPLTSCFKTAGAKRGFKTEESVEKMLAWILFILEQNPRLTFFVGEDERENIRAVYMAEKWGLPEHPNEPLMVSKIAPILDWKDLKRMNTEYIKEVMSYLVRHYYLNFGIVFFQHIFRNKEEIEVFHKDFPEVTTEIVEELNLPVLGESILVEQDWKNWLEKNA